MTVTGTVPIQEHVEHFDTDDPNEAARLFLLKYPDARIEQVDQDFVRGVCKCGAVVFEDAPEAKYDREAEKWVCPACVRNNEERT